MRRRALLEATRYNASLPPGLGEIRLYDYMVNDANTCIIVDDIDNYTQVIAGYYCPYGSSFTIGSAASWGSSNEHDLFTLQSYNSSPYQRVMVKGRCYDESSRKQDIANVSRAEISQSNYKPYRIAAYYPQSNRNYIGYTDGFDSESSMLTDFALNDAKSGTRCNIGYYPEKSSNTSAPLYLMCSISSAGSMTFGTAGTKLYFFKTFDASGNLTHHYKPATKDGIVVIYDIVTGTYYTLIQGNPSVGNI